ncbi:MAG TPA: hypothetical protein VEI97_01565 [bacterium]|nr:hypothetical protein [bacterium]
MAAPLAVRGEFSSADARALSESDARVTLYPASSTTALTLASTDVFRISAAVITAGTTGNLIVTLYDGANASVAAGERLLRVSVLSNSTVVVPLPQAIYCQAGTYPKVLADAAGDVNVTLTGAIEYS